MVPGRIVEIWDNAWWRQLEDGDTVDDWKSRHLISGAGYTVLRVTGRKARGVSKLEIVWRAPRIRLYMVHTYLGCSSL